MAIYDRVVERIITKADEDTKFRGDLIRNPKETIQKEFKVDIPDDIEINVVQDTHNKVTLVLPPEGDSDQNWGW